MKVTVKRVFETTFENDTFWIEYQTQNGIGYEISSSVNEDTDIVILEEAINSNPTILDKYVNKPLHEDIPNQILKDCILECLQSENEMWYVDYDEMDSENITMDDLEKLKVEVYKLKLADDVSVDDGEYAICVYGGAITEVLF